MSHTLYIKLPHSNAKLHTIRRGALHGRGYGTVLLDGGKGGQSSYTSIENYEQTTGRKIPHSEPLKAEGKGLADRISDKLSRLHIAPPTIKPKRKNITMSF